MERRAKEINSIMTADTGYGFTTAEVTLESDTMFASGTFIIPKDYFATDSPPFDVILSGEGTLTAGTYKLVLYKGKGYFSAEGIEVSGYAEELSEGVYLVTGNCTVTIPDDDDDLG